MLLFDSSVAGDQFDKQPLYQLWHLLYSFEGDNSNTGQEKLIETLSTRYGFEKRICKTNGKFNFSTRLWKFKHKSIRKILPHMKEGNEYSVACVHAGYNHSKSSLTKEELDKKELKNRLDILPKNSLRNPVVEKIINQMINVVNAVSESYGKPDEIRIELARELKKSAKEREELTTAINQTTQSMRNTVRSFNKNLVCRM
jgi:CRISPR-associated endonuclease Csn1